jgi:hypothetical protein
MALIYQWETSLRAESTVLQEAIFFGYDNR